MHVVPARELLVTVCKHWTFFRLAQVAWCLDNFRRPSVLKRVVCAWAGLSPHSLRLRQGMLMVRSQIMAGSCDVTSMCAIAEEINDRQSVYGWILRCWLVEFDLIFLIFPEKKIQVNCRFVLILLGFHCRSPVVSPSPVVMTYSHWNLTAGDTQSCSVCCQKPVLF